MKDQRPGVGLRIMHYRANLVSAALDFKPARNGTIVSCSIPIREQEHQSISEEAGPKAKGKVEPV